ncbi:GntR family transcriptional regulator [Oceanobacillus sp. FSL H7-0719]|uniref:GntR family transcriptional regulator n=1 Tax=Oceanobacillus sp. FSL H7-0719 TaxID=2954507 RepID=UPI00324F9039
MPIPENHTKSARITAKDSAYNQIQQWIIEGTLLPGEKLHDTELAEAIGVSRTPIREALQILEMEGFVKMYPGKATQVTEIEREAIHDLLPPLAALQGLAIKLAIENIENTTITKLETINERFETAIQSENFFSALKIDEEFHQVIIDAANNRYITEIVRSLQAHIRRHFFHNAIVLTEESINDHKQIIDYLKVRNAEKAAQIIEENWLRTLEIFSLD